MSDKVLHAIECDCAECNEKWRVAISQLVAPNAHWKPNSSELCPLCEDKLYISSIIPQNSQVNFGCINNECPVTGFIYQGKLYFNSG